MSQQLWWYTVHAGGLVAWALLLAAVGWGLVLSTRPIRRPRPAWALDLHRFLGGLAFVFVAVHLIGLLADSYVGFSVADLLVPMASHWRPGAVAWGTVGLYTLLAVELTSLAMRRLPRRVWHGIHLLSFVALALVTLHAFMAGADASSPGRDLAGDRIGDGHRDAHRPAGSLRRPHPECRSDRRPGRLEPPDGSTPTGNGPTPAGGGRDLVAPRRGHATPRPGTAPRPGPRSADGSSRRPALHPGPRRTAPGAGRTGRS